MNRGILWWLLAGGSFALFIFLLSLLAINSQFQAASVLEQYADKVVSERSSHIAGSLVADQSVLVSVNAVKEEIAQQKRIYNAVKVLDALEASLDKIDGSILSKQDRSELAIIVDKRRSEFKAQQLNDVRLLVRFVRYSHFVCQSVPPVLNGQPADRICSVKEMRDYGQAIPAEYPRWHKVLHWLGLI